MRQKQKHQHVSIEALRDLESVLSTPAFEGLPVGPTIGNHMVIELYHRRGKWNVSSWALNVLRRWRRVFLPVFSLQSSMQVPPNRILVTWMSETFRVKELVFPILETLSKQRCNVLVHAPHMLALTPDGFDSFDWQSVLSGSRCEWHAEFKRVWPDWRKAIRSLADRYNLPQGAAARIGFLMTLHSQYLFSCRRFFQANRPRALLVDFDRDPLWACLVLAAKQAGIPTYTLIHGVVNEQAIGYAPCLADVVFCWGDLDRQKLMAEGEPADRLIAAGCPRQHREASCSLVEARDLLKLSLKERVVMFATAPSNPQAMHALVQTFASALRQLTGVCPAIRLHPSEDAEAYRSLLEQYPELRCWSGSGYPLETCLVATDVVVVNNSGLAGDAMVKHRPVVVLSGPSASVNGYGADLIAEAGCPHAQTAEDLATIIRRLLDDKNERERCLAAAEHFVAQSYAAFGKDAAQRITDQIMNSPCA